MRQVSSIILCTFIYLTLSNFAFARLNSDDPEILIKGGHFFGEIRYRYEHVDQDGFAEEANGHTVRTNLGFKTGIYNNLQGLIEGQLVHHLGDHDFNSTTNGNTTFPVIADPDTAEINQLWLSWTGLPETQVKVGRQKINLDNQRFIGTVGWRQNDQTFDAIQLDHSSIDNLNLKYIYISNVNRIFGNDNDTNLNTLGDLDSNIHVAHASYQFSEMLKLTGYGYWFDFDRLSSQSSKTFGARATGQLSLSEDWDFFYEAELATQTDHGNNTASFDENYYHIAPGVKGHGLSFKVGYEVLEGDGTNAFQTPLATGHKFNGWADAFLTTPNAGLEDLYVSASYKISKTETIFDGTKLKAIYHDYDSHDHSSGDLGEELNLSIGKNFKLPDAGQPFKNLNVSLKYADYDGDSGVASREKFWLQIGTKF